MKRLPALLLVMCLLLPSALAQEAAGPLTLAEIEQFHAALLQRAMGDGLAPEASDGAFVARGDGYEILLSSPDLSADTQVLGAALTLDAHEGEESPLPRGAEIGTPLMGLLALFASDNPALSGTRDAAALYIRGALPEAVGTGVLLRDGQEPLVIEYGVYAQVPGGVARAGMQFTLTGGAVSAARSFLDAQPVTREEAQGEIDALAGLQEEASYSAYPQERALPLSREDLVLFGADFFEATQASLVALLGAPQATETAKDSDGADLLTLQWEGAEAVLRVTPQGERCVRLSATGTALEGPRGLRVGDTLAQALGRFEHGDTLPEGAGALYGDPAQPPYGMLVGDGDDATLYYAIPTEWGTAALMLRFLGDVLVSMDVSYL